MSPSDSVPAADMTQASDTPTAEPPATDAAGAAPAGRAARPARRARAAAAERAPAGALITIIVLLAGAVGGLLLRDLNRIDAAIARLDARFDKLEADMNARFAKLEEGQQEIAFTLTALVAFLRAGDGVDAALSGDVLSTEISLDPDTDPQPQRGRGP